MIGRVDDGGSVRAGEHVGGGQGSESPEDSGLRAKSHLFTLVQYTCRENTMSLILPMWPKGGDYTAV